MQTCPINELLITCKIADLGFSKVLTGKEKTGTVCGTPGYQAPEVNTKNKEGHNKKVDVYALGIIAFELLTGSVPDY